MRNSSPSLAADFLTRWSETVRSWSALAEQQEREIIDWSVNLLQVLGHQEKSLSRALRLKDAWSQAIEAAVVDGIRLTNEQQVFCGEQTRKIVELLRVGSMSDAQVAVTALAESAQGLWRQTAQTLSRSSARLMEPWADFWLLPATERGS